MMAVFNCLSVGFVLLSLENTWKFHKNMHFYAIIAVVGANIFFGVTNWG